MLLTFFGGGFDQMESRRVQRLQIIFATMTIFFFAAIDLPGKLFLMSGENQFRFFLVFCLLSSKCLVTFKLYREAAQINVSKKCLLSSTDKTKS